MLRSGISCLERIFEGRCRLCSFFSRGWIEVGFLERNLKIIRAGTYGSHVALLIMIWICTVLKLFTYLGRVLLLGLVAILMLKMWILCYPVRCNSERLC
jgi:hypothetical protein